ncbi:MAG TPA: sulfotransferase [Caulifigura sp.]|nr:sulfotransferase [Caulifigura sp.]
MPVWCGLTLRNWIRLLRRRPTIEAAYWKRVLAVTAASGVNSLLAAAEKLWFGRRIEGTEIPSAPIFIVGHWRSGTTLLQEFLSLDDQFVTPNLFQCSFPEHFLASERWLKPLTSWMQPRNRPMDAMLSSWDAPAEEEIALLLTTLSSPYLVAAFPDAPRELHRFDNLSKSLTPEELTTWKSAYVRFLKKLTYMTGRTLLLKSPANTARIPLLLELFPDARFIHIVRDPLAVFSSTRHLHTVLSRNNSFTSAEPVDLDERILSSYLSMYQSYHLYRVKIPAERRVELRFEDLERDPAGELKKIYDHLQLSGWDRLAAKLEEPLARHRTFRKNTFQLPEELRRRIIERWEPAFVRYGYPVEVPSTPSSEPVRDQASSARPSPQ